ncbi:MAG: hypothetical protein ACPG32_02540 [Akkermansiaceae bacterium]
MKHTKHDRVHSVMIAGIRVKVQHIAGMEDWGECDEDEKVIRIRKEAIGTRNYQETLKHEMGHLARKFGGVAYCENMEDEAVQRCHDYLLDPAWAKVKKRLKLY